MDLTLLIHQIKDKISVNEKVTYTLDELEGTDIKRLENIQVIGEIYRNALSKIACNLKVCGDMELMDAISNDTVPYSFSFTIEEEIDDFIEKNENILALKRLLWENIVLEVPIRYTTVNSYDAYQGDGWRLISEEDVKKENRPFEALFNQEEE